MALDTDLVLLMQTNEAISMSYDNSKSKSSYTIFSTEYRWNWISVNTIYLHYRLRIHASFLHQFRVWPNVDLNRHTSHVKLYWRIWNFPTFPCRISKSVRHSALCLPRKILRKLFIYRMLPFEYETTVRACPHANDLKDIISL